MKFFSTTLAFALVVIVLSPSCKKQKPLPAEVDLTTVRLTDFQLMETAYSNITITHPLVQDGVELQTGEIEVVIPKSTTQLQLTPKGSNFSKDGFVISPALGVKQNFNGRSVIYEISAAQNPSKAVHYQVRIREEVDVTPGNIQITGFSFTKAKNPTMPVDVESARIIHRPGNMGYIFVFVPIGTDFTSLTPTISHTGSGVFYSQDPNASPAATTTVYPAAGTAIDFAYPKMFYAVIKRESETQFYNVIVDVQEPIQFSQPAVTTANVKAGKTQLLDATTFVNRGNHPLSIVGVEHSQQVPAGLNVIRGMATVPAFGLLPGQSSVVKASVNAQTYPPQTYQVRASFKPRLTDYWEADNLLQPAAVHLTTTIVN